MRFRIFLGAAALLSAAASPCSASLLFDNVSRADFTSVRGAGNSPLAAITVSAATNIDQIGARVDLGADGNLKFLIFNLDTTALLFSTGSTAYTDDGLTFKVSPVFSSFTLNPGIVYGIGAIADVAGNWSTNNSSSGNPFTQNNITASDDRNGNVSNFASPSLGADGLAMIIVQLYGGTPPAAVPEPATLAPLTLACGGLVLAARRRYGGRRSG